VLCVLRRKQPGGGVPDHCGQGCRHPHSIHAGGGGHRCRPCGHAFQSGSLHCVRAHRRRIRQGRDQAAFAEEQGRARQAAQVSRACGQGHGGCNPGGRSAATVEVQNVCFEVNSRPSASTSAVLRSMPRSCLPCSWHWHSAQCNLAAAGGGGGPHQLPLLP